MTFTETSIKGVWIIEPRKFGDHRGYFVETYNKDVFERGIGRSVDFVQDNESYSTHGVLRGLHFQKGRYSQAKLVRVSQGRVVDVAVDLRENSPTYGRHVAVELDSESGRMLFVPRGFAHGFVVTGDIAQFQYKVDNIYAPQSEMTLKFDDPHLDIDWRLDRSELILSAKDEKGISFDEVEPFIAGDIEG